MKDTYSLDISDKDIKLEIRTGTNNLAANAMLALAVFAFLLPVLVTILFIAWDHDFLFGIIISYILLWLSGGFLGRLALWNKYGREVFIIEKKKFIHYNDYKYFKDNYKEKDYSEIEVSGAYSIEQDNDEKDMFHLTVYLDGELMIYSHNKVPKTVIDEMHESIIIRGFYRQY